MSGEGAAKTGGRFNRVGQPTLYLALDIMTAVTECMQGLQRRLHPLTMCEYDVDCSPVADLTTEDRCAQFAIDFSDLACPWLSLIRAGKSPASWRVAEKLQADGFAGATVPSFAPGVATGASNLVLWRWGSDLPSKVTVFDPQRRLPHDQRSWQ